MKISNTDNGTLFLLGAISILSEGNTITIFTDKFSISFKDKNAACLNETNFSTANCSRLKVSAFQERASPTFQRPQSPKFFPGQAPGLDPISLTSLAIQPLHLKAAALCLCQKCSTHLM